MIGCNIRCAYAIATQAADPALKPRESFWKICLATIVRRSETALWTSVDAEKPPFVSVKQPMAVREDKEV